MKHIELVGLMIAGLVAGCAAPNSMPAGASAPVPLEAQAANPTTVASGVPVRQERVDGVYRGTSSMNGNRCGSPGAANMTVRDRTVFRAFGPTTQLSAKVQPDGSFATQSGRTTMSGTIRNGHVELDAGNEYCRMHQTLDRI